MPSGDANYEDRLRDYVQVKDRIVALYELFGQARIETTYDLTTEPDDRAKVICRAMVYRNPEDEHPSTGTSWLYLPGTTPYTRGSEIENAETSAVGRAIGMMGILVDKSIATVNEIAGKQDDGQQAAKADVPYTETEELVGRARRSGTIRKGTADGYKLEARIGPDGHVIGFRLEVGPEKNIPQCIVSGSLGDDLFDSLEGHPEALAGKRATVAGILYHVKTPKGSWYRLHVDSFESDAITLPVIPGDRAGGLAGDAALPTARPTTADPSLGNLGLDA